MPRHLAEQKLCNYNTLIKSIAITAFTGEQMKALGIEESFDIAAFSPGVHISGNLAGQNTQFSIRGVTQNDFNDVIEAPTAVYLDEGYFAIAQAQTFADADQWRVEGAVGGPLSDTVAARAAFLYNQHDGYLDNLYPLDAVGAPPGIGAGADLGDDDTFAFRGALLFEPNEDLSVSVSANVAGTDVATGPYQSKPTTGIYNAAGELIDVIDTPAGETRRSIAADGSDFSPPWRVMNGPC